jgi:exoribonuclease R
LSKRIKPTVQPGLPSREDIVAFIKTQTGKVGKREIARAFGIGGGDRIFLKHLLKELEAEGVIDRKRKAISPKDRLPPVVLADITGRDADGELIAVPAEWDEADLSAAPRIHVAIPRKPKPGEPRGLARAAADHHRPADAKDHDDAVHAVADEDPKNPGGFIVTVAIADVAAYVRPGSALDREALERGNSVYFPDRVVPMLPERISNDLCSLRPARTARRSPCAWSSARTAARSGIPSTAS